jgi:hypothetical protein
VTDHSIPPQAPIELMNLPEGRVSFSIPQNLSPESVQELEYWMMLVLRRIKRTIGLPVPPATQAPMPAIVDQTTTDTPQPSSNANPSADDVARMYPQGPGMGGNT